MQKFPRQSLYKDFIMPFADFINGSDTVKQLINWRNVASLSESEIAMQADRNLARLLEYARSSIPFYSKVRLDPDDGAKSNLSKFPVLTKFEITKNLPDLLMQNHTKLLKYSSSGSSGIQGTVYMSKQEQSIIRAIMLLWWEWAGYEFGKPTFQTGMTTKRGVLKGLKDFILGIYYVQSFDLDENTVIKELKKLVGRRNMFLAGYASSLNVYAEVCLNKGLENIRFDSAICWGDKLFDHYKKNIKNAFSCDVKETYSCNEGFLVGAKKDLDYFYLMSPHVYIEIVDKDFNPVPDGELGYVLLTRLDGFSMPLIRYYVGDLAVKLPREKYPDNREMFFPLLERVIGRDTDVVITPSGKKIIVHFFTGIFEFIPEIRQFMVIQREINGIEIHYIPGSGFNVSILEKLEKIFFDKIQEHLNINWKKVDIIPSTASGKPQLIQSFIGRL
jgi:phenylacetate-CoA ligase